MKHIVVTATEGVAGTSLTVTVFRQAESPQGLPARTWAYEGYLGELTVGESGGDIFRSIAEELFNVASLRD